MNHALGLSLLVLVAGLSACDKQASTSGAAGTAASGETIKFVKTQDGSPLEIKAELFDTPAAKEFLATGKNPYVGKEDAIAQGKKNFSVIFLHPMPWPGCRWPGWPCIDRA